MNTYEKKYKEALERARAKYAMKDQPIHQDLVDIFPELAEPEDERIRKRLIVLVKGSLAHTDEEIDEMLAWLEKQGEQKPAWSEEDEKKLLCICAWIKDYPRIANFKDEMYTVANKYIDWLKFLRPLKRWKPSDAQMASITCAVRNMKESACYDSELVSLLNDLKKLKEE